MQNSTYFLPVCQTDEHFSNKRIENEFDDFATIINEGDKNEGFI